MTSISPRQLLARKTLGLGAAGLLQTVVWLGAIYFSFNLGGKTLSLPENFEFPANCQFTYLPGSYSEETIVRLTSSMLHSMQAYHDRTISVCNTATVF